MAEQLRDAPVEFDPFSIEFFDDPYDTYRRLRDEQPVYHNAHYGFWALSRWDDVVDASRSWPAFSSRHGVDLAMLTADRLPEHPSLIMLDPPEHDRLRKLVSRVFTPRAIGRLEPMIRAVIVELLAANDGRARFDGIEDFAALFPVEIICRMLGVPAEMRQQVRHWIDRMLTREAGSIHFSEDARQASVEMGTYFFELVRHKRAHPAEDMLTRLTEAELETDDGTTRLDDVEIAGFGALLGGAGAETVTKLMGNAFVLFDRHPEQWRMAREDPGLLPPAVEEILRFYPPSQYQGRFAFEEVSLHGEVIPAGSPVLLLTGAACRDPRAFQDPDRFDITRPPALSLGFGHGIHSCLGAALARAESRIALEELARRVPRFSVDHDGLERVRMINVAGYCRVPIEVAPPPG